MAMAAGSAWAAPAFHPAQSAPERALAQILKLDADKPTRIDPAATGRNGRRPRTTPPPGPSYLGYLTTPLATAILADEAHEVKENCGGVYKSGDECGMDADPVICAQDFPPSYLFNTTRSGPGYALIEAAWPPDEGAEPAGNGTYRLKLSGGAWKIDGIACAGDDYNWPPAP
jgi:hypothetical protein